AYLALKLAGHAADDPVLVRARARIQVLGGPTGLDATTARWLACVGQYPWTGVPTVPVEILLLPPWAPFAVQGVGARARPLLVALAVLSAHRPTTHLPPELGVHELWGGVLPATWPASAGQTLSWRRVLLAADGFAKAVGYTPFRGLQ